MHATAKRIVTQSLPRTRNLQLSGRSSTLPARSLSAMTASPPRRGAFILLEGLDRSGKTTQTKLLAQHLNSQHPTSPTTAASPASPACLQLRFPDRTTPIGVLLDSYLRQSSQLDDRAVHLLFAANRWEATPQLTAHLTAGTHLIVDRYSYSGVAFTAVKGIDRHWCWAAERGLVAPDLVVFVGVTAAEAAGRGGWGEERYEKAEVQAAVREEFGWLRRQEEKKGVQWVEVDGGSGRTIEEIASEIRQIAEQTIERVAHTPLRRLE